MDDPVEISLVDAKGLDISLEIVGIEIVEALVRSDEVVTVIG